MTRRSLILALDQGTTSSRSIIFDGDGTVVAKAQREVTQHFPQPGWVEHDATEIWSTQWQTVVSAMKSGGIGFSDIAAVGITNQRETVVLWDRVTGVPLGNAIVWQDRRTAAQLEQMSEQARARVGAVTGLLLDPYFSASKLAWMLDHIPSARARAERGELAAGTIDSWLLWNLTRGAVHGTDVSNASRTMLFDIRALDWSEEMLTLLGIPREVLPKVFPSIGAIASCNCDGLNAPVYAIAGDQQSALFGQLCLTEGAAKCTYGTGCFLLMNTGHKPRASANRLLTTVAWQKGRERPLYALEGSVFTGGAAVQWLRDGLGIIKSAAEVNALAASVPDCGGVEVVPAFTGLGAPWWDPHARGAILGLTRASGAAHIARATLEAIALQVADLVDAMAADAGGAVQVLRVDGGACASDLLMQAQADLLQVPVERPANLETTALGVAMMAGLGAGIWNSTDELAHLCRVERVFQPQRSAQWAQLRRASWRRAVERSRDWAQRGAP